MQYVGSDNNIIDVCHDPLGISVPVAGIPELVEVLLEGEEGETPAERVVRFAAMFDRGAVELCPPPVGALRLVLAFLHRAVKHRDYETWLQADCEAVLELLFDIDQWGRVVRLKLT